MVPLGRFEKYSNDRQIIDKSHFGVSMTSKSKPISFYEIHVLLGTHCKTGQIFDVFEHGGT